MVQGSDGGPPPRSESGPPDPEEDLGLPEILDQDEESLPWVGRHLVALLAITLVGAAARLFRLHEWSLWVDEAHTLRDATVGMDEFWTLLPSNYPIGFLALRGAIGVVPELTEGWIRLVFAFAGIVTVPLLALVGRSIVGTRAALVAAVLLALSPWHLYWSQNARAYAIMLPFAIGSVGAFWTGLQRARSSWFILSLVLLALAGLTHPTAYALAAVYGVVAFLTMWYRPGIYRPGLIVWTCILLVALGGLMWLVAGRHVDHVLRAKGQVDIVHFVQTSAFHFRVPLIVAAVCGFVALRRTAMRPSVLFLGLWTMIPVLAALVFATRFKMTAQYVMDVLPAVCLLAGSMCIAITQRIEATGARSLVVRHALAFVLIAEMGSYDVLYFMKQHGDRPRWREAAQAVIEASGQNRLVLTTNQPSMMFYLQPEQFWAEHSRDPGMRLQSIEDWDVRKAGGGKAYFDALRRDCKDHNRGMFLVLTRPELEEKDADGTLRRWLATEADELQRLPCWQGPKDMTVFVYEVPTG